jgi:hypothetical protein
MFGTVLTGGAGTSGVTISGPSDSTIPFLGSSYLFTDETGQTWRHLNTTITPNLTTPPLQGGTPFGLPTAPPNADGSYSTNVYTKYGNESQVGDVNGDGVIEDKFIQTNISAEEFNAKRDSLGLVDAVRDENGTILIDDARNVDVAGQKPGDPNPVTPAPATQAAAPDATALGADVAAVTPAPEASATPAPEATVEEAPPAPEVEPEVVTLA